MKRHDVLPLSLNDIDWSTPPLFYPHNVTCFRCGLWTTGRYVVAIHVGRRLHVAAVTRGHVSVPCGCTSAVQTRYHAMPELLTALSLAIEGT